MTPEDMAIELVDKYILKTDCLSEAKQLAIASVEKTIKSSYAYSCSDAYGKFMEDPFLTEVIEEINKL
jgi:hypothetical protein